MNEDNKKNINQEILYDNKQYDMARRLKKQKKVIEKTDILFDEEENVKF